MGLRPATIVLLLLVLSHAPARGLPRDERLSLALGVVRPQLSAASRAALASAFVREGLRHGLDPLLLAAIAQVESRFDAAARGPDGSLGLMQLQPATARALGLRGDAPEEVMSIDRNVALAATHLARLRRSFPETEELLIAYNRGEAGARKVLQGPLAEQVRRGYPRQVQNALERLGRLCADAGNAAPPAQRAVGPRKE